VILQAASGKQREATRSRSTDRAVSRLGLFREDDSHQTGATTMATRMQRYFWSIVMACLGAFATSGLHLAQGQDAGAQGRPVKIPESQILAAHGLAMAIDGSTLEALALRRGGGVSGVGAPSTVGPGGGGPSTGTGAGGAVGGTGGAVSRAPFATGEATRATGASGPGGGATVGTGAGGAVGTGAGGTVGTGGGGAVGTGAGGAGGTVSRAPYGRDDDLRGAGGASTRTAGAIGAGAPNAAGLAEGSRASLDPSAMELHRRAMRAFDASDRLIREAAQGGNEGPASRFQVAAVRYANTLRLLAEQDDRIGTTPVLVLNHGVKDVLDSMELTQLVRLMGSSDAGGRALLAHAREMEAEGLRAVDGVLSAGSPGSREGANRPGPNVEAGGQGGPIRTLALQASEVVMAIQELTGERQPARKE
jgi:hypothetical protein